MFLSIDLGSNTIRFALFDNNLILIKAFENIIGAARGIRQNGKISDLAIKDLYEILQKTSGFLDFHTAHQGIATGVWRVANNADEILNDIKHKFGLNFKIISGKNEAALTFLGIKHATENLNINEKIAFIDLGGASTEIGDGDNFKSFNFGIITFFEEFKEFKDMQNNAKTVCKNATNFLNSLNAKTIILTSGVPTTMAAYKIKQTFYDYNKEQINGTKLNTDEIVRLTKDFMDMPKNEAEKFLGKNRQMLVVAGGILLTQILDNKNTEFIVIDDGLREGVAVANHEKTLNLYLKD